MEPWKHEYAEVNGIKMHYVTAGKGPLVILLHGFPQFWYSWRHQIPALSDKFCVVAPDLRGYGDTEKPQNISDYDKSILAKDIADLIHALGYQKADIVGHDWGGGVAWTLTIEHPECVDHLVVINSPHPQLFFKALRSNYRQMAQCWYFFFFQIPYIPESIFKMFSKNIMKKMLAGSAVNKDTFTDSDVEKYQQMMEKPGAFSAALNYYRAAFRAKPAKVSTDKTHKKISVPTLVIWGENDIALRKELTYGMEPYFDGPLAIEYIPKCSHWVHEEQPEHVNSLLLKFLST